MCSHVRGHDALLLNSCVAVCRLRPFLLYTAPSLLAERWSGKGLDACLGKTRHWDTESATWLVECLQLASLAVQVSFEGVHVAIVLIDHVVFFFLIVVLLLFLSSGGALLGFLLARGRVLPARHLLYRVLHQVDLAVVDRTVVLVLEDDARKELVVDSALVHIDHDYVVRVPI